jgi:hypothetical protein
LDFIYSDIERTKTLEELKEAERLYRGYIDLSLPTIMEKENVDDNGTDITETVFDLGYIEDLIEKKYKEFG